MNDPQIAIQLHWIAEGIFALAHAVAIFVITFMVIGVVYILFKD